MRTLHVVWHKVRLPLAAAICVTIIIVCTFLAPGVVARADTDTMAPNIGNFVSGAMQCSGQRGPTPAVRFSGQVQGKLDAVLRVTTDPGWPPLDRNSLQFFVNGQRQTTPDYMWIPAWNGVPGHEPKIGVNVSNPQLTQPVYFKKRWANDTSEGLLAIGWANDADCSITSNPQPA